MDSILDLSLSKYFFILNNGTDFHLEFHIEYSKSTVKYFEIVYDDYYWEGGDERILRYGKVIKATANEAYKDDIGIKRSRLVDYIATTEEDIKILLDKLSIFVSHFEDKNGQELVTLFSRFFSQKIEKQQQLSLKFANQEEFNKIATFCQKYFTPITTTSLSGKNLKWKIFFALSLIAVSFILLLIFIVVVYSYGKNMVF